MLGPKQGSENKFWKGSEEHEDAVPGTARARARFGPEEPIGEKRGSLLFWVQKVGNCARHARGSNQTSVSKDRWCKGTVREQLAQVIGSKESPGWQQCWLLSGETSLSSSQCSCQSPQKFETLQAFVLEKVFLSSSPLLPTLPHVWVIDETGRGTELPCSATLCLPLTSRNSLWNWLIFPHLFLLF